VYRYLTANLFKQKKKLILSQIRETVRKINEKAMAEIREMIRKNEAQSSANKEQKKEFHCARSNIFERPPKLGIKFDFKDCTGNGKPEASCGGGGE
jgi:hypothetical protein